MVKPTFYLIRHAESQGNVDHSLYLETPDHLVSLTDKGVQQALDAQKTLTDHLKWYNRVHVWCSPYTRTRQTRDHMLNKDTLELRNIDFKFREDPRLREQEWGNLESVHQREIYKTQRNKTGHFFYRFPTGESGADVYDRCSHLLESVFRDVSGRSISPAVDGPVAVVMFTHGLTARIIAMRLLHESYEEFESWSNPDNCQIAILEHNSFKGYRFKAPFTRWK